MPGIGQQAVGQIDRRRGSALTQPARLAPAGGRRPKPLLPRLAHRLPGPPGTHRRRRAAQAVRDPEVVAGAHPVAEGGLRHRAQHRDVEGKRRAAPRQVAADQRGAVLLRRRPARLTDPLGDRGAGAIRQGDGDEHRDGPGGHRGQVGQRRQRRPPAHPLGVAPLGAEVGALDRQVDADRPEAVAGLDQRTVVAGGQGHAAVGRRGVFQDASDDVELGAGTEGREAHRGSG